MYRALPAVSVEDIQARIVPTAAYASSMSGFWCISDISSLVQLCLGPVALTASLKAEPDCATGGGGVCDKFAVRGTS